eukprot:m.321951 g.321951  ORF g.321951 m.321951 type:complete len:595 (-) comp55513_c0_seq26:839-2623(-)
MADAAQEEFIVLDIGNVLLEITPQSHLKGSLALVLLDAETCVRWKEASGSVRYNFCEPLSALRFLRQRRQYLYVTKRDESSLPPLLFANGADKTKMLLIHLVQNHGVNVSKKDENLYIVSTESPASPATVTTTRSLPASEATSTPAATVQQATSVIQRVWNAQPPVAAYRESMFEKFAQVTAKTRELISNVLEQQRPLISERPQTPPHTRPHTPPRTPTDTHPAPRSLSPPLSGKTLTVRQREDCGDLGEFDLVENVARIALNPLARSSPVTSEEFQTFLACEDRTEAELLLRARIFHGGVAPDCRQQLWKYLLAHHPSKGENAEDFYAERRQCYATMRAQWSTCTEKQLKRNQLLREQISRIDKDVMRTDRDTDYFRDEGDHLDRLRNILMTYGVYNFDLGYVQGMSDILAVLLPVIEDEADTFWCFVGVMDNFQMEANFRTDQSGINAHLSLISRLIRFTQPDLMDHLEHVGAEHLFFTYRWLLVNFRRDFETASIRVLWEAIWSQNFTKRLEYFVACVLIDEMRPAILERKLKFDEILQLVTRPGRRFDIDAILGKAECLMWHLWTERESLPEDLKALLRTSTFEKHQQHA